MSWSGVFAGALAALMIQILLAMLDLGIGVLSFDTAPDSATASWSAFLWWAVSGIIAAFVGGWVAGKVGADASGTLQGLGASALSSLIVIGAASIATTGTAGLLANLAAPGTGNDGRRRSVRIGAGRKEQRGIDDAGERVCARSRRVGGLGGRRQDEDDTRRVQADLRTRL